MEFCFQVVKFSRFLLSEVFFFLRILEFHGDTQEGEQVGSSVQASLPSGQFGLQPALYSTKDFLCEKTDDDSKGQNIIVLDTFDLQERNGGTTVACFHTPRTVAES